MGNLVLIVLILIILYFLSDILASTFYSINSKLTSKINNIETIKWFWLIMFINIIILVFILIHYYRKKNQPGETGYPGY